MGQYYKIVNLDKQEYLHPHKFGDGLKLLEFGSSSSGTMCGLAVLLASGNNRGGGDLRSNHPIIGSWAGNRIVIAGDYDDDGLWDVPENTTLYAYVEEHFTDISDDVMVAMADDSYLRKDLCERRKWWVANDYHKLIPIIDGQPDSPD